jgi:hypothetical protein
MSNKHSQRSTAEQAATASEERWLSAVILFALTLFVSASLMFVLQPIFGKVLLPLLGGSPSVWNACMVFYQSVLFLGYLYAHVTATCCTPRRQILIHAAILLISLAVLPVALPENAMPPVEHNPTIWLLWMLTISIGLPFFVVSATAPLLQKWFSAIGHQESHDPYFLYAASNTGSLLALLSYPFLIEPNSGLVEQQWAWSLGYLLLALLVMGCAAVLWRTHGSDRAVAMAANEDEEPLDTSTKLHWLLLAFVPSSLLLGVTNFISTDVASVPLMWIIPLALYLLSFIIVFSRRGSSIHPFMVAIQPMVLLPFVAFSFINPAIIPYWLNLALHLLAFFLAIMVCHGELARSRPHTRHLTTFYLIMAFGGMLGGMFNTFVAPFVFDSVLEYPIMIVAALLLRPTLKPSSAPRWQQLLQDAAFPLTLLLVGLFAYHSVEHIGYYLDLVGTVLILLAGITYALRFRPVTLALLTGILLFFTIGLHNLMSNVLFQERTFFGVLSVREQTVPTPDGAARRFHELWHGTTKHGAQEWDRPFNTIPLTYYSRPGPIGQFFSTYDAVNDQWRVGVVGLGAGAMACYAKATQRWDFFELDPEVVSIAKNPDYFTYVRHCAPTARMIIGDARLSLDQTADGTYDLIVLDAFSSDAVPTHLLTKEALQLYLAKLKPGGRLAFHITNRHLDMSRVLATLAHDMRLAGLIQRFQPTVPEPQIVATDWVVMAREENTLNALKQSRLGQWRMLPLTFGMRPWTDDFTNIISVWK